MSPYDINRKFPEHINKQQFKQDSIRLSNQQLMDKYGAAKRTIQRWKSFLRNESDEPGMVLSREIEFPDPLGKDYNDFIEFDSDKVMIIGDVEIPDHDTDMLSKACKVAEKYGIKDLVINGDFVALDSFSAWMRSAVYKIAFEEELDQAELVLREFLKQFERIYWITGNHERRLAHKVDGQITLGKFFEKFSDVTISEYSFCILNSGGRRISIIHPGSYSRKPLHVAYELASNKLTDIVAGHTHHLAMGYDRSGKFWIVDGGHCRDVSKTRYKNVSVTTHPAWNSGCVMILEGQPFLISKDNFNFWTNY